MKAEQRFNTDMQYRNYRIQHLAKKHGWKIIFQDGSVFQFKNRDGAMLRINYLNLNTETSLMHPRWGDTVLFRTNLNQSLIESIFINPRSHMPEEVTSELLSEKKY